MAQLHPQTQRQGLPLLPLRHHHHKTRRFLECVGQYVPYEKVYALLTEHLLAYATEDRLNDVQKTIDQSNATVLKEIALLEAEQSKLEASIANIKNKKERYLDSLVSGQFSHSERKKINDKIDEFSLEEKQIQSAIYRCQFELASKRDQVRSIDPFKQAIIQYKVNHEAMTDKELGCWLRANVDEINLKGDEIKVRFKGLPT